MDSALNALRKVNFDWTAHVDEVWIDQPHETELLQGPIRTELAEFLDDLNESSSAASPLGLPLLGPAGSGKTHLLGFLRRRALVGGMYFVLIDMTDVADFWATVSLGYLRSLQQPSSDGRRQVDHWLERMITLYGQEVKRARDIPGQRPPALINRTRELISRIREKHSAEVQEHEDVLRALILFACDHSEINDLGYKWLQGLVIDDEELGVFGFRRTNQSASSIVRGMSWLLSLCNPSVLALDQLDAIVAEHEIARGGGDPTEPSDQQRRSQAIIQGIAGGLLALRDVTRRTLTVVSSLEATWDILHRQAAVSMADRYNAKLLLKPGSGPEVMKALVIGRLRSAYEAQSFAPPYPAYPYAEGFFETYRDNTPRELLKACEAHRKACRKAQIVTEAGGSTPLPVPRPDPVDWKERMAAQVATLAAGADLVALLADETETLQDRIIETACCALLLENPVPDSVFAKVDKDFMGTGNYDPLHARIRLILTSERERELHHSFRFLEKSHYRAFQARLKAALTASGVEPELRFRGLTILRCSPLPSGAASQSLVEELQARGGRIVAPSDQDLRLLCAIRLLLEAQEQPLYLEEWLQKERPVSNMPCFQSVVSSLFGTLEERASRVPQAQVVNADAAVSGHETRSSETPKVASSEQQVSKAAVVNHATPSWLPIGRRFTGGEPQEAVGIALDRLPYHTCVFAGSGSGKTVFLKRVIEEAALLGIPSIVLDGANDLALLGKVRQDRPSAFSDEDAVKARAYHATTEVVVWTPGAPTGNPMRFAALPDFTPVAATAEEREEELRTSIDIAATSIADITIKAGGANAKKQAAILKVALGYFARRGGTIRDLAHFLREPPDEVIDKYEKGAKLAQELSELLHAAIDSDPLIGGSGAPLDPGLLFHASNAGRTRVSVLNLVGLPSYDQKRRFVDQLAGTLFSWIKKHPAPPGGLLGLLVIDEAKDYVPSGKSVPGKENVIRLAAQARKYGLGLLFATQEPKSIEHTIVSNCSTLLGGKMNSPAAIDALQQLLADKGTRVTDIAALKPGTFYFASGADKPRKIATSLCLSDHPSTSPTEVEVLATARQSMKH